VTAPLGATTTPALDGIRAEMMTVADNGKLISSYAGDLLSNAEISLAIDQASTLKLTFVDPERKLLSSPLLNQAMTIDTGANPPRRFTMVKVSKSGDMLAVTYEDSVIAKLRKQKGQLAAAAGVITREQFAAQLLRAAGVPAKVATGEPTATVPLTRGTSQTPDEDTWACLTRIAGDVQYRCFSDGVNVWFGPDSWLLKQAPAMQIAEYTDAVDTIDFDFDVGKPVATAKVTTYSDTWLAGIGAHVAVQHLAAATGDWLVSAISRSLFLKSTGVTLIQAQPELPEPVQQDTTSTSGSSSSTSSGTGGSGG
jgi:hypothetical protein